MGVPQARLRYIGMCESIAETSVVLWFAAVDKIPPSFLKGQTWRYREVKKMMATIVQIDDDGCVVESICLVDSK